MNKLGFTSKVLAAAALIMTMTAIAQAQSSRTWVSGVGDDINPCSRTAPCKTFSGAISKTFINGEINVLDSAGYGTLTITKSMTVDGTGAHASMLSSNVNGVNINIAANVNDPLRNVVLRNLSINGTGASGTVGTRTGVHGVSITTSGANNVWIEDCVIFNFSQNGVRVLNVPNSINVFIRNSVIRDNGLDGVVASSTSAAFFARVTIENSHLTGNQNGVNGGANSRISVDNSTLAGNTNAGALSRSLTAGLVSVVNVSNGTLSNNLVHGVQAGGGGALATSFVRLNKNHITGSGTSGVNIGASGQVDTYGNNQIFGNNIDGCPGCAPIPAPNS